MNKNQELGIAHWLATNTKLTPKQIHSLCPSVHEFKIMLLQSGTCILSVETIDPTIEGMVTKEEIYRMENNLKASLPGGAAISEPKVKRYIPRILRHYIPSAVLWLHQYYPSIPAKEIGKLFGIAPKRIVEILNTPDIKPINPVTVQLFSENTLADLIRTGVKNNR